MVKKWLKRAVGLGFVLFLLVSQQRGYQPGVAIGEHFLSFLIEMMKILPLAFILIGLFEVWVKQETVEKHLGKGSSPMAFLWVILLASTTVGGAYVALPVAYTLYHKNARLAIVLTYLGASAISRIPMSIFEASFLGVRFTLTRFLVSIPLVILSSLAIEAYFVRCGHLGEIPTEATGGNDHVL